jgi:DNA-binding HxlR family transcriptional regulator
MDLISYRSVGCIPAGQEGDAVTDEAMMGRAQAALRSGAYAIGLLSDSLDARLIVTLGEEEMPLRRLRQLVGAPAQTTLRKHLSALAAKGLVQRRRLEPFPGNQELRLSESGRALLPVAASAEAWLARCPAGAIELGTPGSRSALKALVEGWSSLMLRALAGRPLSLTQLDRLIGSLNYPSVERRVDSLRVVGLIRPCEGHGRSTPYTATRWLRTAVAPLLPAVRWERRFGGEAAGPVRERDIEAALLLGAPLICAGTKVSGRCRIAVQTDERGEAGALLLIEGGRVVSCSTELGGECSAAIKASIDGWITAILDGDVARLTVGGNAALGEAVATGMTTLGRRVGLLGPTS